MWIVSYDIPDDRRRTRIAKILEGYGQRAQYSVFECDINEEQCDRLEQLLRQTMRPEEDDIRFYPLNRADVKRVRMLGTARIYRARSWYMIGDD